LTINERILANEGKIAISVIMGVASWVIAIVVVFLITILPMIFTGQIGELRLPIAFAGVIINIVIAFNYKKADFVREYLINDIPSPILSIPIGIIIVLGLTLYMPLILLLTLFMVYLYYIKRK
jgi:hypothetical protein